MSNAQATTGPTFSMKLLITDEEKKFIKNHMAWATLQISSMHTCDDFWYEANEPGNWHEALTDPRAMIQTWRASLGNY